MNRASEDLRFKTGIAFLDGILGGGLVPGSVTLLAGLPGIGKTTLAAQASLGAVSGESRVLYASAEESINSLAVRMKRFDMKHRLELLLLLHEQNLLQIVNKIGEYRPQIAVLDSVQVIEARVGLERGSDKSLRTIVRDMVGLASETEVAIVLVAHMTPLQALDVLVHHCDTALFMSERRGIAGGDKEAMRCPSLTCEKNRYGDTPAYVDLELTDRGFVEKPVPMLKISDEKLAEARAALKKLGQLLDDCASERGARIVDDSEVRELAEAARALLRPAADRVSEAETVSGWKRLDSALARYDKSRSR